jgi:hypothetical protein
MFFSVSSTVTMSHKCPCRPSSCGIWLLFLLSLGGQPANGISFRGTKNEQADQADHLLVYSKLSSTEFIEENEATKKYPISWTGTSDSLEVHKADEMSKLKQNNQEDARVRSGDNERVYVMEKSIPVEVFTPFCNSFGSVWSGDD